MDYQAVVIDLGEYDMGFWRSALYLGGLIGTFHDHIGLGKSPLDVTDSSVGGSCTL
jgi:hypothetical protein